MFKSFVKPASRINACVILAYFLFYHVTKFESGFRLWFSLLILSEVTWVSCWAMYEWQRLGLDK